MLNLYINRITIPAFSFERRQTNFCLLTAVYEKLVDIIPTYFKSFSWIKISLTTDKSVIKHCGKVGRLFPMMATLNTVRGCLWKRSYNLFKVLTDSLSSPLLQVMWYESLNFVHKFLPMGSSLAECSFVNSLQQKDIEYQFWIPLLPSICIDRSFLLMACSHDKKVVKVK